MKEVVWVFGSSAAGKQTFIRQVLNNKDLQRHLGWQNRRITACQESLDYPGHIGDKKVLEQRKRIIEIVPKLLDNADIVLIKWQYIDSHIRTPQKLKELLTSAKHKIIFLEVGVEELKKRLAEKSWWQEFWDDLTFVDREQKLVVDCLAVLADNFETTILNSSVLTKYK